MVLSDSRHRRKQCCLKTETEKRELYLRQREEDTVEASEREQNRPNTREREGETEQRARMQVSFSNYRRARPNDRVRRPVPNKNQRELRARVQVSFSYCRRARPNDRVRRQSPNDNQRVSYTPLSSIACTWAFAQSCSVNPLPFPNHLDEHSVDFFF